MFTATGDQALCGITAFGKTQVAVACSQKCNSFPLALRDSPISGRAVFAQPDTDD